LQSNRFKIRAKADTSSDEFAGQRNLFDVARHANDFAGQRLAFINDQALAKRVFAGEIGRREGFVDGYRLRRLFCLLFGERAALQEWNALRAQIVVADFGIERGDLLLRILERSPLGMVSLPTPTSDSASAKAELRSSSGRKVSTLVTRGK